MGYLLICACHTLYDIQSTHEWGPERRLSHQWWPEPDCGLSKLQQRSDITCSRQGTSNSHTAHTVQYFLHVPPTLQFCDLLTMTRHIPSSHRRIEARGSRICHRLCYSYIWWTWWGTSYGLIDSSGTRISHVPSKVRFCSLVNLVRSIQFCYRQDWHVDRACAIQRVVLFFSESDEEYLLVSSTA